MSDLIISDKSSIGGRGRNGRFKIYHVSAFNNNHYAWVQMYSKKYANHAPIEIDGKPEDVKAMLLWVADQIKL